MALTLSIMTSCSGHELWYKIENLSSLAKKEDIPSKDDSGEEQASGKWQAIADSSLFVLTENFLNKDKGYFWSTPQDIAKSSGNIYWQQAHAMDVIISAYSRIKDTRPERAGTYRRYMELWFTNYANNYNTSRRSEGVYGGFFNAYTDDMCWICLTLCHISEALGDDKYIQTAKEVYDSYIIPRLKTDEKGSGLPWTDIADKQGRNSCTNAPGCCLAAKLHAKFGEKKYLDDALTLYSYMTNNNVKTDFRCEEPPLTYTQGTFGEACRLLYHITGDRFCMDMAFNVINYAFTSSRCNSREGILRNEGTSMDQSIFKAVLIPYTVNLIMDSSLDKESRAMLKEHLLRNGEALYRSLDRSSYPQMYANYYWGSTWQPAQSAPYASMGAQVSGASLMEGMARLEQNDNESEN